MFDQMPTRTAPGDTPGRPPQRSPGGGLPWYAAVMIALLVSIATLLIILVVRNESGDGVETVAPTLVTSTSVASSDSSSTAASATSTPGTTAAPTSASSSIVSTTTPSTAVSTTTSTGSTSTLVDPDVARSAIWPFAGSPTRFDDPTVAAQSFATDFVGFTDPVVGPFLQGDGRSGEVEVRPDPDGPVTVVLVRQLGADDAWWVIGAATASIELDRPDALDVLASPLEVSGRSVAFEATVDLELRVDGTTEPLVTGIVMGGATELAPFAATFPFDPPGRTGGAVLLFTISAEDGTVWEASIVRVAFADS